MHGETVTRDNDRLKARLVERFGGAPLPDAAACDHAHAARWSDFDLNPHAGHLRAEEATLREAAVLMPIIDRPAELTLLLTQRTQHLSAHAGQISLPGGRREPEDSTPVETALRETREEVGILPDEVRVIGAMDCYETRTGFLITPIVGLVAPDYTLVPNTNEVEEVFEVPLAFLLDPRNHKTHSREYKGMRYHFHAMPYHDYYIWGATAAMLKNLYRELME
jgi:8-oxo-dGTP pyrophosphatase MutT (NUDIX family)